MKVCEIFSFCYSNKRVIIFFISVIMRVRFPVRVYQTHVHVSYLITNWLWMFIKEEVWLVLPLVAGVQNTTSLLQTGYKQGVTVSQIDSFSEMINLITVTGTL